MNNVSLLGRIATDLELKRTQNNKASLSFTIAVDRYSSGNKSTDFIRCTAWGKTAENIAKYFSKGSTIAVNGSIHTGNYTDKNGIKRYITGVAVSNFYFTCSKKEQNNSNNNFNNYNNTNRSSSNSYQNNSSSNSYGYKKNNYQSNTYPQSAYNEYSADKYNGRPEFNDYDY